jgi:hypothetical protein
MTRFEYRHEYGVRTSCGRPAAQRLIGIAAVGLTATTGLMTASVASAQTICSVLENRPCTPTFCSVFDDGPCRPEIFYPFGQGLRLTTQGRPPDQPARPPAKPLNTLQELFGLMDGCWIPPPIEQSRPGTEITIRFTLNRAGEILGEPRFTYSTPALSQAVRSAYQQAVADALSRCTPFPLSDALGGAIAGRPISWRLIDNRGQRRTEHVHER